MANWIENKKPYDSHVGISEWKKDTYDNRHDSQRNLYRISNGYNV